MQWFLSDMEIDAVRGLLDRGCGVAEALAELEIDMSEHRAEALLCVKDRHTYKRARGAGLFVEVQGGE